MIKKFENKGNQLFPDYQMIKRENTSQREFEEKFSSIFPVFDEIIYRSFDEMKKEEQVRPPHYRNRNWNSNTMNSNIQGLLIDRFGRLVRYINGRYYLKLEGKIFAFKKLDNKNKRPSHNETVTSTMLVNQYALTFEEPNSIIWIGYCVDDSWCNILGTYAVSIDGKELEWAVNLSGKDDSYTFSSTIDNREINFDQVPLVTVKQPFIKAQ